MPAGIELTISGFNRPLLYRLSYETRKEQVGGDCGGNCGNVNVKEINTSVKGILTFLISFFQLSSSRVLNAWLNGPE